MKRKAIALILMVAAMSVATACGNTETTETESSKTTEEATETKETAETVEEVVFDMVLSELDTDKYVELGEYKGLKISEESPNVTQEEEDNYIDYILESNKTKQEVTDRAAKEGDIVNIDYEGKKDGVAFDGGTAQGTDLKLGSHTFIDGFEDGLIGAKAGDTKELNLTFPENYAKAELAGQDVVFTVKVNKIQEETLPELTDDFVKEYSSGELTSVEEFRKKAHDTLVEQAQDTYNTNVEADLTDAAMEKCKFLQDMPKELIDGYLNLQLNSLEKSAKAQNVKLEDAVSGIYGITLDEFKDNLRENIQEMVKQYVMLQAIANKEGLTVDQEVVDHYTEELLKTSGFSDIETYKEVSGVNDEVINEYAMAKTVLAFLKENAEISESAEAESETETETADDSKSASETESVAESGAESETETE